MAKGNSQKTANDSGLNFEAQLWAAPDQAVPASHLIMAEYNCARPEGLSDPKSEWFIKDEPQRAEAAENRVAAGAPVSDPARFKFAVSNAPDRRSALRFMERCRIPRNADSFRQDLHDRSRHGGTDFVPVQKDLANRCLTTRFQGGLILLPE